MAIVDVLMELGGIARRHQLLDVADRAALEAAVGAGAVLRDSRGLYHLPGADSTDVLLRRFDGVLCLTSAALAHGWAVKTVPDRPHLMVSRVGACLRTSRPTSTTASSSPPRSTVADSRRRRP